MLVVASSTTSRSAVRRPGVTTAGLLIGTTVLLSVAALSLDMAVLMTTKQEAQSACDAGALAGASQLWDVALIGEPRRSQLGLPATAAAQVQEAVSQATSLARTNTVTGEPVILDETRDIAVTLPEQNASHGWIAVTCPFTAARGKPLRQFIGSLLGAADVDVVIQSRAALDQRVYGFQPAGETPVPLAPLVIDPERWSAQVESGAVVFTFSAGGQEVNSPAGEEMIRKAECTLCTLTPGGVQESQAATVGVMLNQDQVDLGLHALDLQSLGGQFALDASGSLELRPSRPADAATVAWIGASLELAAQQRRYLVWPLGQDTVDAKTKQVFRRISGFSAGSVDRCDYNGVSHTLTIQVSPAPLITSTALVRPGQPRNAWIAKVYLLP